MNKQLITKAVNALKEGKVICFPTETVYALAADATSETAIQRLYEIKQRSADKPISILVNSTDMASSFSDINVPAQQLLDNFSPGPLTVIVPMTPSHPIANNVSNNNTIGVRIPDHIVALEILNLFDNPIAATSVNHSGEPAATSVEDIHSDILQNIDIVIDSGVCAVEQASTVVSMLTDTPIILRQGSITNEAINAALR